MARSLPELAVRKRLGKEGVLRGNPKVQERLDGRAKPPPRGPLFPRARDAPPRPARGRLPSAAPQADGDRDLDHAVNALRRRRPDLSAGEPIWTWHKWTLLLLPAAFTAAMTLAPEQAIFILATVLVVPFFCVVALRTAALWNAALGHAALPAAGPICPHTAQLPRYSVLVPIYDEAAIVPDLIAALGAIDYPRDRLEIFLILESVDAETRAAVAATSLPSHIVPVVVPDGSPRTKPRALNYALRRATGDLVVIYDAEDVPEPDQLRRAAKLLATDPKLGCVQARLNVLNDTETWLTRQFAIEYTVLFDCLLPTLDRLGLPVPLGGTSNHFSRAVLEEVGAWDPFNVTEDADLGIRLARAGWTVKVLASTTWEEAPANFKTWLKQRTRWLKGWMQTYLVHMRAPRRTARDLGWLRFFGLQVLMGGLILSALVHPWFYVVAIAEIAYGPLRTLHHHALSDLVTVIGITNLVLGYVTGVALGCVAVAGRARHTLAVWAFLMPVYWLLISLAAYRALLQLASTPYSWEKTQHRPRAAFAPNPDGVAG
jgi:cellulose synthase/poly-beta-1,6-N-acetylglucosamine synthase-like glycosyltransferase